MTPPPDDQDDELPTRRERVSDRITSDGGAVSRATPFKQEPESDTELEVRAAQRATSASPNAAPGRSTTAPAEDTGGSTPGDNQVLDRGASVGRYIVLGTLGQGGMGVVYAAYDSELDRKVAIKLLRGGRGKDGQARLVREAQAMARISHPNVISVYEVNTLSDRVFVAMEFVDGTTLRRWLKEKARPWREVLEVFVSAGKGLSAAHAAGLVHRDFKPENVLVGKDGRVYVTDFGLARLAGESSEATPAGAPREQRAISAAKSQQLLSPLTQEGLVVGTPNYMAPEQHQGRPPDTRTDQFAFCAALYWALWGKRPFDPQKLAEVAAEIDESPTTSKPVSRSWTGRRTDGVVQEPPSRPRVPAWVRRAVMRGLSLDPADRYPSIEELLRVLEVLPQRQRNVRIVGAAAAAVIAATATLAQVQASRLAVCSGGEQMLTGVWDDRIRGAMEKAFVATGVLEANGHLQRTAGALDQYATAWTEMHRDACEATRVRKVQTEEALSLRMLCLDRRLRELRSLTGLLATADTKLVGQSVDAVLQLPSARHCADVAALSELVPMPTDPAQRKTIEAVTEELAAANALRYAGQYPRALERAAAAWSRARSVNFKPIEAEALYLKGWLEDRTGNIKDAEETLVAAVLAADAGRDDHTRAQAALRLLYSSGQQQRLAEGHRWAGMAQAAIDRLGGNRELEADLLSTEGSLFLAEGKTDEAIAAYQRALKLVELELGKDHPKRANNLANLGSALQRANQPAEAVKMLTEAVSVMEKLRGPDHPALSGPLFATALAQSQLKQFDRAHASAARSLAIVRARYGPAHPRVAANLDLQGTLYQEEGRFHEALGAYQAALEIKKKALPPESPEHSSSLDGIGHALLGLGRPDEAQAMLEKALKLRGPDPVGLAETRFGLARALWELGKEKARARGLALQARADYEKAKQGDKADAIEQWIAAR